MELLFACIFALSTIALMFELNNILIIGIAVSFSAILVSNKKAVFVPVFLALILSFSSFHLYNFLNVHDEFINEELSFEAKLLENPEEYEDYTKIYADVKARDKTFKSILYIDKIGIDVEISDTISGEGYFYAPRNKNGFNSENYYKSDGIFILGSVLDINISKNEEFSFIRLFYNINENIKLNIDKIFDLEHRGFVKGLILGDKEDFSDSFKADISKAGISHILAVSGLHVGYLVSLMFVLFGKKNGNYAAIFIIIFFILVVGFSPSIIRASIMNILLVLANLFSEKYDSKRAIAIAFTVILFFNPYAIFDVGFVLSFASSAGIIYLFAPLNKKIRFKNRVLNNFLARPICISLSVSAATTIPLVLYFNSISTVSIFTNILVLPIVSILFPLLILVISISFLSLDIASVLSIFCEILIDIIKFITEIMASFRFALVYSDDYLIVFSTILFVLLIILGIFKEKLFKICIPLAVLSYYSVIFFIAISSYNSVITTVFPVDDGEALVVTYKDEVTVINCGATKFFSAGEQISDFLYEFGYDEIDNFIVTSIDKTHIRDVLDISLPVLGITAPNKPVNEDSEMILQDFVNQNDIKSTNYLPSYIEVIEKDDKKLAVLINNKTLTLHAFTNKMIDEFLSDMDILAPRVILAEKAISDYEALENALEKMGTQEVILSNDYEDLRTVSGVNARSTIEYGAIRIKEKLWKT